MSESNEIVEVPFEGDQQEQATLLLAAAEDAGEEQRVVRVTSDGFQVPKSVADKVSKKSASKKVEPVKSPETNTDPGQTVAPKESAKKTAAKKTAKKAPAKKSAAKTQE